MKEFDIKLTALKRGEIIRKNKSYATQNIIVTQRPMFKLHGSGKVGEVLGVGPSGY